MLIKKTKELICITALSIIGCFGIFSNAIAGNIMFSPKLIAPFSKHEKKTILEREELRDNTLAYYYYEDGPNKNLKKAKFWVEQGIKKSERHSYFLLGLMHFKGDAAKKDLELAMDNLKEAAEMGHSQANEMLGLIYYYGIDIPIDFDNAYLHLSEIGETATPESKTILGKLYYSGDGTEKDYKKSFEMLYQAANANHPEAQAMLSVMYSRGEGVEKSIEQSNRWLLIAAEKSNDARILMGIKYEDGEDVIRDYEEAYYYYYWAKNEGSKSANKYLDKIKNKLTPIQIAKVELKIRAKNSLQNK